MDIFEIDYEKKYIFNSSYELLKYNNYYLYINYEDTTWLKTDLIGYEIISSMKSRKSLEDLIISMEEKKGIPNNILKKMFEPFFKRIVSLNLIIPEDDNNKNSVVELLKSYFDEIWIHLTTECNLSCPFCYAGSSTKDIEKLNHNDIIMFLEKIPDFNRGTVVLSGGEPLLYDGIVSLCKDIKKLGYTIQIITNGTLHSVLPELVNFVDIIQVSLDGSCPDINDKTRGKGSFNKTIEGLKIIKKSKFKKVIVSFTATKYNIYDLKNLPRLLAPLRINGIHISQLIPSGRAKHNYEKLKIDKKVYMEEIMLLLENLNSINKAIMLERTKEKHLPETKKTPIIIPSISGFMGISVFDCSKRDTCGLAGELISIGADGNIYPCNSLHNSQYCLGDIFNPEYEELIKECDLFSSTVSVNNVNSKCYDCNFKYFCGGSCRALTDGVFGSLNERHPDCEFIKDTILNQMWSS